MAARGDVAALARAACAPVIICWVRLRSVHPGDVVLANHKGRIFYARVVGHERAGVLRVEPLERNVTWRSVKAREVVDHWTHAAAGRDDRPSEAQLAFDGL